MDLDKLKRALGTWDVAEDIYNVDQGKTLGEALALYQEATDNAIGNAEDEPENGPATIRGAVANHRASKFNKPIKIGANKTKTLFNGVPKKDASRSFNAAGDKVAQVQKQMEGQITDHRSVNNGEIGWAKPKPSAEAIRRVKDAVRKSREAQTEGFKGHFYPVNETAMAILAKKAALNEAVTNTNTTPAAKTIATHRSGEPSIRTQLPVEFSDSKLLLAQRQENNVRDQLPNEWKDAKAQTLAKQRAGQLQTWNNAANSLKVKPNAEQSALDDKKDYGPNGPGLPQVCANGTQAELPQPAGVYRDQAKRRPYLSIVVTRQIMATLNNFPRDLLVIQEVIKRVVAATIDK